jgi:hypothetical protein
MSQLHCVNAIEKEYAARAREGEGERGGGGEGEKGRE